LAIAIIAELHGATAEFDDQMTQRMGIAENPAPGALARIAGPIEGGWRIMAVWESQEAWDTFRIQRLEPALKAAGQDLPQFQIWPLHTVQINR
jgi:hypothetical protein